MNITYPEDKFIQKCNLKSGNIYRLHSSSDKNKLFLCISIADHRFLIPLNGETAFRGLKVQYYEEEDWFIEVDHELIIKD